MLGACWRSGGLSRLKSALRAGLAAEHRGAELQPGRGQKCLVPPGQKRTGGRELEAARVRAPEKCEMRAERHR